MFAIRYATVTFAQTDVRQVRPDFSQSPTAKYRLFPTSNLWIFIKLNTSDGRLWLVQYSTKSGNQFEIPLSNVPRATTEEKKDGRFNLYATSNMFNFLLLDQIDGRVWQVQWSRDGEGNMVIPII